MTSTGIVQKLWNYCNVMPASLSSAHVNLPACRLPVFRQTGALLGPPAWLRAGAGRRDDLSACGAQAGGMSYGDYPSAKLRDGVWRERISAGGLSWEVHEDHP